MRLPSMLICLLPFFFSGKAMACSDKEVEISLPFFGISFCIPDVSKISAQPTDGRPVKTFLVLAPCAVIDRSTGIVTIAWPSPPMMLDSLSGLSTVPNVDLRRGDIVGFNTAETCPISPGQEAISAGALYFRRLEIVPGAEAPHSMRYFIVGSLR